MNTVPTIDLHNIDDHSLSALDAACRDHGFFLLKNHGLEQQVAETKAQCEAFFALPRTQKLAVMRRADNPMGYYDRELTKQKRDLKEVFDFFARDDQNHEKRMPWPDHPEAFKATLRSHFLANSKVAQSVMQLLCRALGIEQTSLDSYFSLRPTSTARLNYYPSSDPLSESEQQGVTALGDMALHHHTDQGAITLLFQDDAGGLQAHSRTDGWIDVPPQEGTVVVNIGDLVQVWTNGQYRAALHRVLATAPGTSRISIPFFYQPNFETLIAPLSSLGEPVYQPFVCREFIQGRIDDNYTDLGGEEDTQIEKYRIVAA
ncbi:MAG: isopenicillin N synthase-like dioxygenase [Paraglaciecola psychrophila]|jgi:isopenicillin N synthase-like dioxygenase